MTTIDPSSPLYYCKYIINYSRYTIWNLYPILDYDPNMYTAFGFAGITSALVFCNMGAAYGTGKAGIGIC